MYSFELLKILDRIRSGVSFFFGLYIAIQSVNQNVKHSAQNSDPAQAPSSLSLSSLDRAALSWDHNQTSKVGMNFLDQEKCSSKCHTDIWAQKPPLKIIGEEGHHEPNLPAVCSWKASFFDGPAAGETHLENVSSICTMQTSQEFN